MKKLIWQSKKSNIQRIDDQDEKEGVLDDNKPDNVDGTNLENLKDTEQVNQTLKEAEQVWDETFDKLVEETENSVERYLREF